MTTSTQNRLTIDEYFIQMAILVSRRGTCVRRQVGCVLVNNLNHVIATGYNGRARGVINCLENPCGGSKLESGTGLERCEAIHAEANALLQCRSVQEIKTTYCTTSPCIHCTKLLMNTGCERIVFRDQYPGNDECRRLWVQSRTGRVWDRFTGSIEALPGIEDRCEHVHWIPSAVPTNRNDTIYRECYNCGLLKEVLK